VSEINGIATDPLSKVAQTLARHDERLDDHERRITQIEEDRDKDKRERQNFTLVLIVQTVFFVANLVASIFMKGR